MSKWSWSGGYWYLNFRNLQGAFIDSCRTLSLDYTILESRSGLFMSWFKFKVFGTKENIDSLRDWLKSLH